MAASTTDKITDTRNAARPISARVSTARVAAATTLSTNGLTGWPTASKVHFVTYQIDTNSNPIAGTQLDCSGIVSGANLTSVQVIDGTDGGNSVGDVVEMLPTASWGQDLSDALLVSHNRDGSLISAIVTTTKINDSAVTANKIASSAVTTTKINDAAVTSAKVSGLDKSLLTTDSNPYKFHAYRNAASSGNGSNPIVFDTEKFDTNNNYNTSDGKYTAPVSGFYFLAAKLGFNTTAGNIGLGCGIIKNTSITLDSGVYVPMYAGTYSHYFGVSGIYQLVAGDFVQVIDMGGSSLSLVVGGDGTCTFQGFLVSQT